MSDAYGPKTPFAQKIHAEKYRGKGETFRDSMTRVAARLSDTGEHFEAFRDILLHQRFLPGGRIQASAGSTQNRITPYNCFVSGTIADSYTDGQGSIMERAKQAAVTMRLGGGIGYDFSTLRPRGELIRKLNSQSSGAVSFMHIYDAICLATASSGHRRGAQMGVLRIDHPDIEEFIRSKQNSHKLLGFNISIAVTDDFMRAVKADDDFALKWGGRIYRAVRARDLWEQVMRSTYDWAEPGVLFIDTINENNNLKYAETIAATNPCGEQPLPPFGACLLGSFNLTKYITPGPAPAQWAFDYAQLSLDIPHVVRAMDNVIDIAEYPLFEQEQEAKRKRRMGLGVTGAANAIEALGYSYGSPGFCKMLEILLRYIRDNVYRTSVELAQEKGAFPLYQNAYLHSPFIQNLPQDIQTDIAAYGIRNSHLLSIAPTGTISLAADNVSSGIEPVFSYEMNRTLVEFNGNTAYTLTDYGYANFGVKGRRAADCTVTDHLAVLRTASQWVDSAVSKTCNLPADIGWEDFKDVYIHAWEAGCKGITTYRDGCLRGAVLTSAEPEKEEAIEPAASCEFDPATGRRSCE